MRAWIKQRRQPEKVRHVGAWIRQIAMREALRVLERSARRPIPMEELPGPAETDEGVDRLQDRLELTEMLSSFTTLDRALVLLRYVADMSQPEVATALDMPEGTVKVRLHRIRQRLRSELENTQEN